MVSPYPILAAVVAATLAMDNPSRLLGANISSSSDDAVACRTDLDRRQYVSTLLLAASVTLTTQWPSGSSASDGTAPSTSVAADAVADNPNDGSEHRQWQVTLPLEACPGGASCLRVTLLGKEVGLASLVFPHRGSTGGIPNSRSSSRSRPHPATLYPRPMIPYRVYRVIVDTGSPYLVVSENDLDGNVLATGSYPAGYDNSSGPGGSHDAADIPNSVVASAWPDLVTTIQDTLGAFLPDGMIPDADKDVPFQFSETMYGPTEEIYGSQSGSISWMGAPIKFRDDHLIVAAPAGASAPAPSIILGAMDDSLTRESGGSLLGLVKRPNLISTKIQRRPTFMEQMRLRPSQQESGRRAGQRGIESSSREQLDIAAFRLDYPSGELTLSSTPLIPADATYALPLVDLRPLGDFVEHYACIVEEVIFDGIEINCQTLRQGAGKRRTSSKPRDIVAVFDSGLTGCLLIKPLWDRLVQEGLDPSSFASVEIKVNASTKEKGWSRSRSRIKDESTGRATSISSSSSTNRLFYVSPISLDWFDDEETAPYVIVVGQTFLTQGSLTVDIDDRRAIFQAV